MLTWHNHYHAPCTTDLDTMARYWQDDECSSKIRTFYQSDEFDTMQPISDFALEALKMLKKRGFHLVIITSRQQFIAEETKRFVDKHYPGIFESIYFCNLGLTDEEQRNYVSKRKSTICQEIGVDVLIDHQLEHCIDCANIGVDVLLYDPTGQQQKQGLNGIKRVKTWREIIHHHFPKPNSPLRHLVYSYSQSPPMEMDNDDDNNSDDDDDYQMDQDGNEIVLLSEDDDDGSWV
ncbi:unnamed protein product [Absidia cylindrospora]